MRLQEAILCVDCEALYSISSRCPQCGSEISFPLARALNRGDTVAGLLSTMPSHAALARLRPVGATVGRSRELLQSN